MGSYSRKFKELKLYLVDILEGKVKTYDVHQLHKLVCRLYDNREITKKQYDDLILCLREIEMR